jgi:hypothetical protein
MYYILLMQMKFIERFHEQNEKVSNMSFARVHKSSSSKPRRYNTDDTDSESDNDNYQQAADQTNGWIEEWKLYLNTFEVMPDNMGIVHWWGVCLYFISERVVTAIY